MRVDPAGSSRRIASTRLLCSKNAFQSTAESRRRLSTQLPTVTWLAAWRWCSRRRTSLGSWPCAASSASSRRQHGGRRPLVAQQLHQPDDERIAQLCQGCKLGLGKHSRPISRRSCRHGHGLFHPALGPPPLVPAPEHLLGQAPEVLEQDQAEHRGQGPELADRQGDDLLERLDEPGDPRLVELAVGVRDQRQGQRVDAGIARERRDCSFGSSSS